MMQKVQITCTDTGKTAAADVIKTNTKELVVVLTGTQIRLVLRRTDARKPYVGNFSGMEFTYQA